jgi:CDP-paratose 2-epimerase
MASSVSLCEPTAMSQKILVRTIELGRVCKMREADIQFYVSDHQAVTRAADWTPKRSLDPLFEDVWRWL